MKCALCDKGSSPDSKLCSTCNQERLAAASLARIAGGGGLTWSNVEAYSEENWIKAKQK